MGLLERPAAAIAADTAVTPAARTPDAAAVRKFERAERREQLYAVVRAALAEAGFPPDGCTFKVVALDAEGWRYLVLVDVAQALAGAQAEPERVQDLVVLGARSRAGLQVDGVWWRPAASPPTAAAAPPQDA